MTLDTTIEPGLARRPLSGGLTTLADAPFVDRLQVGDLLLIRTSSGIGRIVRALDRTRFNHCAIHLGDGLAAHVLPPKSMRGNCVAIEPFPQLIDTLAPELIAVRRPPAGLATTLAAGARFWHRRGPAFSFNDLLVLATVADTSDRLADSIGPIGPYLDDQGAWESLLAAHFGVAGPDAITCAELVVRSMSPQARATLPRPRRGVPDAWQVPITADESCMQSLEDLLERLPHRRSRLHRRRGYTPMIKALGDFAIDTGQGDLGADHLRVALTVLRHIAADFNRQHPFDLRRLRRLIDLVLDADDGEWRSRLTTPGDLARATDVFAPTDLQWVSLADSDT